MVALSYFNAFVEPENLKERYITVGGQLTGTEKARSSLIYSILLFKLSINIEFGHSAPLIIIQQMIGVKMMIGDFLDGDIALGMFSLKFTII